MPTKITPLPKTGTGGGGGGGGRGGGGGGGGGGGKATVNIATSRRTRIFNVSRFTNATAGLTRVAASQGYLHAIIFAACVGLALLTLGSVLVHIGDDKYIVDVMVLGGIFVVMGAGALVVGCVFVLLGAYMGRKAQNSGNAKGGSRRSALPPDLPSPETEDSYLNPAFMMDELRPTRGTSSSAAPGNHDLYDRNSLGASENDQGRLVPPSPPPLSKPASRDTEAAKAAAVSVLTTIVPESDDVSEVTMTTDDGEAVT